jgi:hypothetical protein
MNTQFTLGLAASFNKSASVVPDGNASQDAAVSGREHRRQAWQRELEQALAQSWFHAAKSSASIEAVPHGTPTASFSAPRFEQVVATSAHAVQGNATANTSQRATDATPESREVKAGTNRGINRGADGAHEGFVHAPAYVHSVAPNNAPAKSISGEVMGAGGSASNMAQRRALTNDAGSASGSSQRIAPAAPTAINFGINAASPLAQGIVSPAIVDSMDAQTLGGPAMQKRVDPVHSLKSVNTMPVPDRMQAQLSTPAPTAVPAPVPAPVPAMPMARSVPTGPVALELEMAEANAPEQPAAEPMGVVREAGGHAPEQSPVRLHVQWQGQGGPGQGASVWLGIDAHAQAWLPQLTSTIQQWLRGQGVQVNRLVCNGRELTTPDSNLSETSNTKEAPHGQHRRQ